MPRRVTDISSLTPGGRSAQAREQARREHLRETLSTETRPLWAVAAEEWDPLTREWELVIRYNHATSEPEARATYARSRTQPFRIVSAGVAIGYHVKDKKGLILAA